ncbi:hypothetical protein [Solibacillus sp. NPDC093137]|uniref:hypothetical protein n=1 Tax=Solibacillus sp. NPDC093137 TaxID=3390678 RepID=UPI003CFE9A70
MIIGKYINKSKELKMSAQYKCRQYEQSIKAALNLKGLPKILYADNKSVSISAFVKAYGNRADTKAKGLFLHRKLPFPFNHKGVIIIREDSVATLAHELMHYKQWTMKNHWLRRGPFKTAYYNLFYYFYPTEVEAFDFAEQFIKTANLNDEYLYYRQLRQALKRNNFKSLIVVAILCILVGMDIYYLLKDLES